MFLTTHHHCSSSEDFLRRVRDVDEAVLVPVVPVQVCHGGAGGREDPVVDEQKQRLQAGDLEPGPQDLGQLREGQLARNEELASRDGGQVLLVAVPFHNQTYLGK